MQFVNPGRLLNELCPTNNNQYTSCCMYNHRHFKIGVFISAHVNSFVLSHGQLLGGRLINHMIYK